jgi:hypothetical protein
MGWNAWNHFKEKITDKIVRAETDAMVSSGMKAAGYEYIVIDDSWSGTRDPNGFIHPNEKFPDMKALADYVPQQRAEDRDLFLAGGEDLRGLRLLPDVGKRLHAKWTGEIFGAGALE